MKALNTFQLKFIDAFRQSALVEHFYLTGGTALSAFYLQHRYSLDLDFFTDNPASMNQVPAVLEDIAEKLDASVHFTRQLGSFLACFFENNVGERIQIDFAQDSPYRLNQIEENKSLGIQIENFEDIACNKLSALFDRAEPKDFVDIYFICQEKISFDDLVEKAKSKHVGMDDYWLAIALQQVEKVELLPRMIKPLSLDALKAFFLTESKKIMARLSS